MSGSRTVERRVLYTVDEIAQRLGASARWLADQCRAERVEHVHIARQRRFTHGQVELLIASRTVRPVGGIQTDATRSRVLRLLARRWSRLAIDVQQVWLVCEPGRRDDREPMFTGPTPL